MAKQYASALERWAAASMGPPLKAAENEGGIDAAAHVLLASMGPPLKAAENLVSRVRVRLRIGRFNGAAAKSSGKFSSPSASARSRSSFNGAAAKRSGTDLRVAR